MDITVTELINRKSQLEVDATKLLRELVQAFVDDTGVPVRSIFVYTDRIDAGCLGDTNPMSYYKIADVKVELGI